jgi:hypothetical protein
LLASVFPLQTPWNIPRLEGREPSHEENLWLSHVQDGLHQWFSYRSKSFRPAAAETMLDIVGFGNGYNYQWAKPFGLPEYKAISIFNGAFLRASNGDLTHFFYETKMTKSDLMQEFPDADLEHVQEDGDVEVVYAVRPSGKREFPYFEEVYAARGGAPLRQKRLEEMPFYAPGFMRRPQDHYAMGAGHLAYPFAEWLNRIQESILDGAEKSVDPPLFDFTGGAIKQFDRRANAVNVASWAALGFSDVREALQPFGPTGDLRPGIEMVKDIRNMIYLAFYIDWLEGSDQGVRTATEVADRRNLRMQSLSTLTARLVPEWASRMTERTFRLLLKADYFDPMPESLRDELVSFEYRSPLLSVVDTAESEIILAYAQKLAALAAIQPDVVDNFDTDKAAREIFKNDSLPAHLLKPLDDVTALREARDNAAAQREAVELQQGQAAALRDGGQGAAALIGAGSGQ